MERLLDLGIGDLDCVGEGYENYGLFILTMEMNIGNLGNGLKGVPDNEIIRFTGLKDFPKRRILIATKRQEIPKNSQDD